MVNYMSSVCVETKHIIAISFLCASLSSSIHIFGVKLLFDVKLGYEYKNKLSLYLVSILGPFYWY